METNESHMEKRGRDGLSFHNSKSNRTCTDSAAFLHSFSVYTKLRDLPYFILMSIAKEDIGLGAFVNHHAYHLFTRFFTYSINTYIVTHSAGKVKVCHPFSAQ